jgi:large subunit ribosomal protein L11
MIVKLLVEGGAMKPGPAISQQLGPAGINLGQVISKVNEATANFKGLKVPVELDVNTKTKDFKIKVSSPPVSELMKKEIKLDKGSGLQAKEKVGNVSIEQVISVAKTKLPNMLCRDLKTAVKTVVGTCVSMGLLVENKNATDIVEDIDKGKYDKEISEEKTETSPEKLAELENYFKNIKTEQEKAAKAEEAAKEAAEAEKAEKKEAAGVKPEAEKTAEKVAPVKK